jgi:hypothetical protein
MTGELCHSVRFFGVQGVNEWTWNPEEMERQTGRRQNQARLVQFAKLDQSTQGAQG